MENTVTDFKAYQLSFHGKGSSFFGIIVVNWLLTLITLGIYYPWAKAKKLAFLYGSTALNEDRFAFHGTGKEMFKGFLKAILFFVFAFAVLFTFMWLGLSIVGILAFYAIIIAIMPIAIHGSYRYRMSRTSWRGIRFGYRGDRTEFIKIYFAGFFLTIITIGIYGAWFVIKLRNYILSNIKFGNIQFKYEGNGGELFILNLKGYLLSLITLGIYAAWWQKDLFAYYIDNLSLHKGDQKFRLKSTATGGEFFVLFLVNILLLVFTLGLGYAWVVTRTMNFMLSKIEISGDIDLDSISQTEAAYTDATGEDVSDFLNIDFIV